MRKSKTETEREREQPRHPCCYDVIIVSNRDRQTLAADALCGLCIL